MDLAALDAQLYNAITTATAGSKLIAVLVVIIAWINWNGLVWWLIRSSSFPAPRVAQIGRAHV